MASWECGETRPPQTLTACDRAGPSRTDGRAGSSAPGRRHPGLHTLPGRATELALQDLPPYRAVSASCSTLLFQEGSSQRRGA